MIYGFAAQEYDETLCETKSELKSQEILTSGQRCLARMSSINNSLLILLSSSMIYSSCFLSEYAFVTKAFISPFLLSDIIATVFSCSCSLYTIFFSANSFQPSDVNGLKFYFFHFRGFASRNSFVSFQIYLLLFSLSFFGIFLKSRSTFVFCVWLSVMIVRNAVWCVLA